ncbi:MULTISPECIES: Cof-type HAD-IIB family hydrolase [Fictibacillus]|uniref:Cof-type HAD-IIB family hydrolase n=1 Tax=Fictibacillus terranigra TaxID=3058424 RepID=A0ABT8E1S8_9BACL|nr:Cof-type HAD-IIB family hydrolase [Fictibacillus sp. CENA-BCM004]MDN4071859.1 Cof-type HAD-IIB family hydrolase [Fictibacillus sp. CENA-BCM004]
MGVEQKEIKLIALDMDGTLLNDEQEISEGNRMAIREAQAEGVHVVLSTGRSLMTCRDYAKSLELNSYLVTVNGSEVWDSNGNLIERTLLHNDHIEAMMELTKKHSAQFWAVSTDKVWRETFPENCAEMEWLKFGFNIADDEVRKLVLEELAKNKELEISNSSLTNIEVNAVGINKARALDRVCRDLGITMDHVIAMGDSLNDIAMITEAGIGVAMGNAQDVVKDAADWVTGTNVEDGVAQAIRHWVL